MTVAGAVIGGAIVGAVLAWLVCSAKAGARMAGERSRYESDAARAAAQLSATQGALESERSRAEERREALDEMRRSIAGEFADLSRRALDQNSDQFLKLADSRMKQSQQAAVGELEQRRQAIEHLLTPLREQLGRYEQGIRLLELERQRAYSQLSEQVRQLGDSQDRLQSETRNLVTALRSPSTRGRWGEMQLRRVVEMAGMLEHCDFDEQQTTRSTQGALRPDLVVRLPGHKQVVVDAKVPMQAFLDANDATDEAARRGHLELHAKQLRSHIDALSKKTYWQHFDESPEFVVAFVPGDPLLAAAFEHDAALIEHAVESNVLLATPTTLIALLRAVAQSWQSEAMAANAREVQKLGRELYRRLSIFGAHMSRTGKSLRSAVDAYNKAVGSLEHNVLPQARRFSDLGVVGGDQEELGLEQVEAVTRNLQSPELTTASGSASLELVLPDAGEEDDDGDYAGGFSDAAAT